MDGLPCDQLTAVLGPWSQPVHRKRDWKRVGYTSLVCPLTFCSKERWPATHGARFQFSKSSRGHPSNVLPGRTEVALHVPRRQSHVTSALSDQTTGAPTRRPTSGNVGSVFIGYRTGFRQGISGIFSALRPEEVSQEESDHGEHSDYFDRIGSLDHAVHNGV